jgi:hypothetical protein
MNQDFYRHSQQKTDVVEIELRDEISILAVHGLLPCQPRIRC